jgi:non-specific serine/threonine protein kinase/serine/threonine-protein kinase
MSFKRWQRIKEIFGEAIDRPEESRASFLDSACAGDLGLRSEVGRLLLAHGEAGGFLSQPATVAEEPPLEGRRIGPYRILSEVGRGGMGLVYRAVRDDDVFQKTVALKLVPGGASPEERRRFRQERQILARLQHPNVANIMDGGTSDEGQPYLVMEYVEGEPIDAYCNRRGLSVRERLLMYRKVCDAVHYAHQNLVVHRDLKPENILVSSEGEPKLLDFGIAKLVAGADEGESPTTTLAPRMTPAYASPEQVRGEPVTTASEVYSLGVVLYELLTGELPYRIEGSSLEEVMKTVCDTEPAPPSAVVRRRDSLSGRTRARELEGDLDTIVDKAMRKEPERRYLSVRELSEDVRRHLERLPVLARSDTLAYRASKLARRHWAVAATAALFFASLVLGLAATFWQWRRAEANRLRAEERLADVRALANSFLFEFHDAILNLPGSTAARQLVVERAAQYLDRLAPDAPGDLSLQRELASAYQRLGEAQGGAGEGNLGDTEGALASYEKALAIRRALGENPGAPEDIDALAQLEMKMSRVFGFRGDWERAEEIARAAAGRLESIAGKTDKDHRGRLATIYHTLGFLQARRGNEEGALRSLRKAVDESTAYADEHPEDVSARANVARHQTDLLDRLDRRGEYAEAKSLALSAWGVLESLVAEDAVNTRYRRDLIYALNIGAASVENAGDLAEANRARRRALDLAEDLLAADPSNQGDQIAAAYCRQYLGSGLVRSGEVEEGLKYLEEAARLASATARAHPGSFTRGRIAEIQADKGMALHGLGTRPAETCAALRESVAIWEDLDGRGELSPEVRGDFDEIRALLPGCALDQSSSSSGS